jgi:hypothetical protein
MAFEAKRLRVQLPCGEATVQDAAMLRPQDCDVFSNPNCPTIFDTCAGAGVTFPDCAVATDPGCGITRPCRFDSATCAFDTCAFRSPCGGSCAAGTCGGGSCGFPTPATATCRLGSCQFNSCGFVSPRATQTCRVPTLVNCLGDSDPGGCLAGTDPTILENPGTIVVNPEQLTVLKAQLESQLAEVAKAEQALKQREQQ